MRKVINKFLMAFLMKPYRTYLSIIYSNTDSLGQSE